MVCQMNVPMDLSMGSCYVRVCLNEEEKMWFREREMVVVYLRGGKEERAGGVLKSGEKVLVCWGEGGVNKKTES